MDAPAVLVRKVTVTELAKEPPFGVIAGAITAAADVTSPVATEAISTADRPEEAAEIIDGVLR
jgi:hypothetical protein